MVIRNASRPTWTTLDNRVTEDERLSFGALGLLTYLIGRSPDWEVMKDHLANSRGMSVYAITKLLSELRNAGYARLVKPRNPRGQVQGSTYEIYESPEACAAASGADIAEQPTTHDADTGELTPQLQAYLDTFTRRDFDRLNFVQINQLNGCEDADALLATLEYWRGQGWNPKSVAAMCDRYRRDINRRENPKEERRDANNFDAGDVMDETREAQQLIQQMQGNGTGQQLQTT